MRQHRLLHLSAALLCLAVSISAGWLWHALSEVTYEARARLARRGDPFAESGESSAADESAEETVLAPEVLSAAADLLRERGFPLSSDSPFDSETDCLLSRIRVESAAPGAEDELRLVCTGPNAEGTLQILQAVVDAFLATAVALQPVPAAQSPAAQSPDKAAGDWASGGWERERRQLVPAIERQERAIAALVEQLRTSNEAPRDPAGADDDAAALPSDLAEARRAVADAERRLDDARRDFDRKLPVDVVVARLADGPARTKIVERLGLAKLKEDLRQQQTLAEKLSAVYGRNHPRMHELREKIEQINRQIAALAGEGDDPSIAAPEADPPTLVLGALEHELADARATVHQLESRLISRNDRFTARQELEAQLGEARQELAFLHSEYDRVRRQIDSARRDQVSRLPTVIEPPTLSPDPITPHIGLPIAVSCVAGMALYLFLLRQLRARLTPAAAPAVPRKVASPFARGPVQGGVPAAAPAPPLVQIPESLGASPRPSLEAQGTPIRAEQMRTQAEQRLARLKMLSTHGAAPASADNQGKRETADCAD